MAARPLHSLKSPNVSAARLRRIGKDEFVRVSLADQCEVSRKDSKKPASCPEGNAGEESGKSWRAHREIKGYAGSSEHRIVADECEHAAGNGAADNPADTDESYGPGSSAVRGQRYD